MAGNRGIRPFSCLEVPQLDPGNADSLTRDERPGSLTVNAQTSTSRRYLPHAIWAALVIVPFAYLPVSVFLTDIGPSECSGIGWGCTLAGADGAGFVLIFFGIPALLVLLVGHLVIGLAQWFRRRSSQPEDR